MASQYTTHMELFTAINDKTGRFLAMTTDCTKYKAGRFTVVEIFDEAERTLDSRWGRRETFIPTPGKHFAVLTDKMTKRELMNYLKALWVTVSAGAMVKAEREAESRRMVSLDASTPAALSATLETLRHWMVEQGVACVTIMPQDVAAMGVDADTASQRMWDAAQDAITETRFEAKMVWKDAKEHGLLLKGEWKLFSLAEDLSEDEDDASDIFFCAGGKYATADDFIRAHQKDNSPEEWYIVEPAPMAPRGWDVAETDHD